MSDLVQILDGNTFVVSDARRHRGVADRPDRAVLVRHALPVALGADRRRPAAERAVDRRPPVLRDAVLPRAGHGTVYVDAKLSVIRQRAVGDGFHEELTILNHDDEPVDLDVRIDAGSDFADLFEVKDALKKKGDVLHRGRATAGCVLGYERETFARETVDLGERAGRRSTRTA